MKRFLLFALLATLALAAAPRAPAAGAYGRFLPPDQAFRLSAGAATAKSVRLDWQIANGYYLYRSRFKIVADTGAIGAVKFPAGETENDPNFGRVVVYRHRVALTVPVREVPPNREIKLNVTYQGCADAGLCYAPISKNITLTLPSADAALAGGAGAAGAGGLTSQQDRLARLVEQANPFWFFVIFFGLGVLLAFTPCVLPMVPILAGIVGGEAGRLSTRRGFTLSLVYVLAMAVVYTAAGVGAGFAGSGLQAYFQAPWVIALFVLVFVALALSLFGWYELRLPNALVTRLSMFSGRRRGGTWVGAAAMGALSALIVSPCIAAPLAGALVVIGQGGEPLRGGVALAALALGMGAPLLVYGTVMGRLLPHAGRWMTMIERLLGVAMLAYAVWLLGRVIPAPATLVLWGLIGMLAAWFLTSFGGKDAGTAGNRRLFQGLGTVAGLCGLVLIVGGAVGGKNPLAPLAGFRAGSGAAPQVATLRYEPINSPQDLEVALSRATARGQPVMVDFYADWCTSCLEMEHTTFRNPGVLTALGHVRVLRADVTANTDAERALLKRFGLYGPPAYLFFDHDGHLLAADTVVGYLDTDAFLARVHRVLRTE